MNTDQLYVIAVISNPVRYRSRYDLFRKFEKHVLKHTPNLYVVEMAFGERPFEITERSNPQHIQLRTEHELWHKENMINIAISRLPSDWKYVAWVDADIEFLNPNWVSDTVHELQHHHVVQMFQDCVDLGPKQEIVQVHRSFTWSYHNKQKYKKSYEFWHPGYAWAATREAIDSVGGLMEFPILGAGDHHMALSLVGRGGESVPKNIHPNYTKKILEWQAKAEKHIKRDIGFVPGSILHYWHGKKANRKYIERWDVLTSNQYNPETDIKRSPAGVLELTDRSLNLRDQIRHYFRQRNEDSIDN